MIWQTVACPLLFIGGVFFLVGAMIAGLGDWNIQAKSSLMLMVGALLMGIGGFILGVGVWVTLFFVFAVTFFFKEWWFFRKKAGY